MIGMTYKITMAIKGVMSNIPSLGITRLNGDKIGLVRSSSIRIKIFCLLRCNQDNTTLTRITFNKIWQKYITNPIIQTTKDGWKPVMLALSRNERTTNPIQTKAFRLSKLDFLCGLLSFPQ